MQTPSPRDGLMRPCCGVLRAIPPQDEVEHDQLLLDLRRKASPPAPSIDQQVTDVLGSRFGVGPTLGQGIRNARNRAGKAFGPLIRSQVEDPVDGATEDRVIRRLRRASSTLPVGLSNLARRLEPSRQLLKRAPGRRKVGRLECQRLAGRRLSDGIFHDIL